MNRIARRLLTLARLTRTARGAVIAVVLALLWAAPAAAAQPTRVVRDLHPFVLPAGTACPFDVEGQPSSGFVATTTFSDGTVMSSIRAKGQYVNMETGASFWVNDTWTDIARFDPATGIYFFVDNGQADYYFLPGDQGPFGVVGSNAAFYRIVGTASTTWDSVANRVTQFAYSGTVTDICAALS